MAGNYTYDAPGVTEKDTIRFLIQDTDPHDAGEWQITDEEIQWAYDKWYPLYHSEEYVAAQVCETIAARYAREASYSADGVSVSLGPVGDQYRALAASLRLQYQQANVGTSVEAGGMLDGEEMIPGTKPFAFGKGMHDHIEAGRQDWGGIYPPELYYSSPRALPPQEQIIEGGEGTP
jgi:hypothetical protein